MTSQPIARTGTERAALTERRNTLALRLNTLGPEDAEEAGQLRAEVVLLTWAIVAHRIGVPSGLQRATLREATTAAVKEAIAFIEGDLAQGHCLVLSGPTGVGKSYAAIGALRAAVGLGQRVSFAYFPAFCNALMTPDQRSTALAIAKEPMLILFDDFGAEYTKAGGFLDSLVEELFWHREANNLPTILTTNLTVEQMRARLSERIVDRLRGAWGRVVELPGESLRRKEHP